MKVYTVRTNEAGDLIVIKVPDTEIDDITFVKAETKKRGYKFKSAYLYPWKPGDRVYR